ncbi:threonine-phosphate decarboxylase CobD [Sutcliffiella rhizosphaerae]|uniref:threonine-phosphate decarboxylase n=1 Tax=Sutcliffiella rhizosphaerae TaxID=2880967 RepID=A0ABN8A9D3_9BACI|nr:threonine-phosphate decarboxylase CobD [Sutcliffiella rhizosphaerae]CAG9620232.1 Threonine-phosphate decarboxylase [Sutcliffiella rhizosphaerae]
MKWPDHGGQPTTMKQLYKMDESMKVLDFSANLNPLGPPQWLKGELELQWDKLLGYPDPHYAASKEELASFIGVTKEQLLLTNGGAEAIFLAAKYFEGKRAAIVHPAFSEYERACQHYHLDVKSFVLTAENYFKLPMESLLHTLRDIDVLFLCRPNNPTGTLIPKAEVKLLLDQGLNSDTYIVVDEAFIDFVPEEELTFLLTSYPNLILLRSLTKMYTIPGLRLGFLLGDKSVVEAMEKAQIPWSVNALADSVAPKLLKDDTFVRTTLKWLKEEIEILHAFYEKYDFYMSPTKVNFYLLQDKREPERTNEIFNFLFKRGVLPRHTHNFKGLQGRYMRFAVRSKTENTRLMDTLRDWRRSQ